MTNGATRAARWWSQKHCNMALPHSREVALSEIIDSESGLRFLFDAATNLRLWLESHPEAKAGIPESEYTPLLDALAYVEGK